MYLKKELMILLCKRMVMFYRFLFVQMTEKLKFLIVAIYS